MRRKHAPRTLLIEIPGMPALRLGHLVLDFNGTLARDGVLLPGVRARLRRLSERLDVYVLTADTFGTARSALRGVNLELRIVSTGTEKRRFVSACDGAVAIGNGRNDVPMMRVAELSIAVLGPEGSSAELLRAAQIVVRDIVDALDLLLRPKRVTATLRR
ncbi:MAG: ATPase P [Candidatus Binatia bacterium]